VCRTAITDSPVFIFIAGNFCTKAAQNNNVRGL